MGQLLHEGRHVGADRDEHLRVLEGKTQCSVASHRDSGYGASRAAVEQAKAFFHLRNEVADKEIFVANTAALRVDIEAGKSPWSNDHELANLLFFLQVLDD